MRVATNWEVLRLALPEGLAGHPCRRCTGRNDIMALWTKAASAAVIAAASIAGLAVTEANAQGKTITLCWAAWDPANALVELSKDFTAKSGVNMKFEFVPWPNFTDRMQNELNSKGKLCDLLIGDSQ